MAIDADLNAGLIDDVQAKERRAAILQEADFYGSMDGSSKFVKGDAIAGIIITIVNIIGGFMIGVFMHDMEFAESAQTYTILTIGDGLVSQIPALIISTAVGIITTRASSDGGNFAETSIKQLVGEYRSLIIVGFILLMFSAVPGLPGFSLFFLSAIFLFLGFIIKLEQEGKLEFILGVTKDKLAADGTGSMAPTIDEHGKEVPATAQSAPAKTPEEIREDEEKALTDILKVEVLELDLGYQLIRLADSSQGGDLLDRIRGMRRKIAESYGFIMPQVRIRDNLQLLPSSYRILLKGVEIGKGEIESDKLLAMNSGMTTEELEGEHVVEPAFGIDATWITIEQKDDAIVAGYTVVDPSTVLSTHMSELVKKYSSELLTRQEVQYLLDKLKESYPIIVEDCTKVAGIGLIQQVLKSLLSEKIPINDMVTILETVTEISEITKSSDIITEQVRSRLSRVITDMFKTEENKIRLLTLATNSEQFMINKMKDSANDSVLLLNAHEINILVEKTTDSMQEALGAGVSPVILVVDPTIRRPLSEIFTKFNMQLAVLSHAEIDNSVDFEVLSTIEISFEQ
jgi:flagellar biosynthesis protein FlhA